MEIEIRVSSLLTSAHGRYRFADVHFVKGVYNLVYNVVSRIVQEANSKSFAGWSLDRIMTLLERARAISWASMDFMVWWIMIKEQCCRRNEEGEKMSFRETKGGEKKKRKKRERSLRKCSDDSRQRGRTLEKNSTCSKITSIRQDNKKAY